MNTFSKISNYIFDPKNILNVLAFFFICLVFVNFIHNSFEPYSLLKDNTYIKKDTYDFKKEINIQLSSKENYSSILDRPCEITGNMHDRHKVRWVKALFLNHLFKTSYNINESSPYYVNIFLHSFLIFLTLIFLDRSFKLEKIFTLFFLLYVTFIFQQKLGEYSYSIFEMFFTSLALYASKNKKIILFLVVCILSTLNRESGFLTLLTWFLFNNDPKKFAILSTLTVIVFLILNFDLINCMINPKFFLPLKYQEGQVNLIDLRNANFLSIFKLLITNFIFPFGLALYFYLKSIVKNKILILILMFYFLLFLFATPLHHMAVRLILLPLIFSSIYFSKINNIESK